jgi:adenosylhomocysteine nucleosidase
VRKKMNIAKPILIQGAMEVEIETLKKKINNLKKEIVDDYEFYVGELEGYPIVISKTEIGIMNVGISTAIAIKHYSPKIIINQGTAGGFGTTVHRGDIVVGTDCFNLNSYKTTYKKRGEGSNPNEWELLTFCDGVDHFEKIEADKDLVNFIKKIDQIINNKNIIYGTISSGDCWNQEIDRIEYINNKYGALCEDMETIGVYKTAKRYNVPVVGIRVISDNEILEEEYDRTLASNVQDFVISLCRHLIREGKN